MKIIFTDIDGVLNPSWKRQWSKKSIAIYNRMCADFDLRPVITSTWRTNHTMERLQEIFIEQGITTRIHDFTPVMPNESRGLEIDRWLKDNTCANYVVIDDACREITPYVSNVVEVRGWIGLEEEHYDEIKRLITK